MSLAGSRAFKRVIVFYKTTMAELGAERFETAWERFVSHDGSNYQIAGDGSAAAQVIPTEKPWGSDKLKR